MYDSILQTKVHQLGAAGSKTLFAFPLSSPTLPLPRIRYSRSLCLWYDSVKDIPGIACDSLYSDVVARVEVDQTVTGIYRVQIVVKRVITFGNFEIEEYPFDITVAA